MKVSVITVCFNAVSTIGRTITSVNVQDHNEVEHIIVDGASTDGTQDVINKQKGETTVFVSEQDKGIYEAMNKGLSLATGDIICFLNADDYYASSNILSRVSQEIEANNIGALMTDVSFFHKKDPKRVVRRYRSNRFTPKRLSSGWMPAHPGLFLSREVVNRVGIFNSDYLIAGDFEFIVRVFSDSKLRYKHLSEVFVFMQLGGISTRGLRETGLMNIEVLRACKQNGIKTNIFKILSKYPEKLLELIDL